MESHPRWTHGPPRSCEGRRPNRAASAGRSTRSARQLRHPCRTRDDIAAISRPPQCAQIGRSADMSVPDSGERASQRAVEGLDFGDATTLTTGQMNQVARTERSIAVQQCAGMHDVGFLDRPDLGQRSGQRQRRVQRVDQVRRNVACSSSCRTSADVTSRLRRSGVCSKKSRAGRRSGCSRPTADMKTFVSTKITKPTHHVAATLPSPEHAHPSPARRLVLRAATRRTRAARRPSAAVRSARPRAASARPHVTRCSATSSSPQPGDGTPRVRLRRGSLEHGYSCA